MNSNFYNNEGINGVIRKKLNDKFAHYGSLIFAYAIMNKKEPLKMAIINNHPTWFDIYLEKHYQLIDPVIIKSLKTVQDFSWDKEVLTPASYKLPKIFAAGEKHNIESGHTFVLHDYKNNLAVLSLIAYESCSFDIETNRAALQSFFISLHEEMLRSYDGIHKNNANALSQRESEVLYWVGLGKTYFETSVILGISQRTVKFHINNIVKKLGVSNARHAVKLSIELDLLNSQKSAEES
ncbi:helix-turn-helix transcriptional regulator [[Erwinia] mediterraneensis]|uniref:helix-turn-helix transcriptional regulator n=1 Tax=[Erwinia] mediterraneensis TaxID=2161819 RepID=UPI00103234CC|nr:LuxR family transcriptional regulator [[Erwinia] mediterraneensis]